MNEPDAALSSRPGLRFPRIKRVVLRDFSLFNRQSEICLEFGDGVFCLAGANGLGKSTFVAALNFAITGRVPDPERRFESVEEYYRHTGEFSATFFSGRIAETERETAEVEVELGIGDTTYRITRGMFEPGALRRLEIIEGSDNGQSRSSLTGGVSPSEMDDRFRRHIARKMGLQNFEQFAFLQLFLLTFDERRSLTFWDAKVLERLLFLAFGVDPATADHADELRRSLEKLDSRIRNAQWHATEVRSRLKDIEEHLDGSSASDNDLVAHYDSLVERRDMLAGRIVQIESELRDRRLRFGELSAQYVTLQKEYEDAYTARAEGQRRFEVHPLIVDSLNSERCALCGTTGEDAISRLRLRVREEECPLCGSPIAPDKESSDQDITALRQIDRGMGEIKERILSEQQTISRLEGELNAAAQESQDAEQAVADFEAENEDFARGRSGRASDLIGVAESYRTNIQKLLEQKQRATHERDRLKVELGKLQRGLQDGYRSAEADFVPSFRDLAHSFLGLDLDVRLETRSGQMGLVLEVQNQERRLKHQLSESQRFFVDIALRMALARFMASGEDRATMLIDTPEGSLDSAYESRAGEMFANFVRDGNHIVMTANINTSQLLLRLAERCGLARMKLSRMTEWTDLSEVQLSEESLFKDAYSAIEDRLAVGGS